MYVCHLLPWRSINYMRRYYEGKLRKKNNHTIVQVALQKREKEHEDLQVLVMIPNVYLNQL